MLRLMIVVASIGLADSLKAKIKSGKTTVRKKLKSRSIAQSFAKQAGLFSVGLKP